MFGLILHNCNFEHTAISSPHQVLLESYYRDCSFRHFALLASAAGSLCEKFPGHSPVDVDGAVAENIFTHLDTQMTEILSHLRRLALAHDISRVHQAPRCGLRRRAPVSLGPLF